jgi:hypothetical protein
MLAVGGPGLWLPARYVWADWWLLVEYGYFQITHGQPECTDHIDNTGVTGGAEAKGDMRWIYFGLP